MIYNRVPIRGDPPSPFIQSILDLPLRALLTTRSCAACYVLQVTWAYMPPWSRWTARSFLCVIVRCACLWQWLLFSIRTGPRSRRSRCARKLPRSRRSWSRGSRRRCSRRLYCASKLQRRTRRTWRCRSCTRPPRNRSPRGRRLATAFAGSLGGWR